MNRIWKKLVTILGVALVCVLPARGGATSGAASTFVLTVTSSTPSSGVQIVVTPAGVKGASDGATPFTRTYNAGTNVTLTAVKLSGRKFVGWSGCTSPTDTLSCQVKMNANTTVRAIFSYVLTVESLNPASGLPVTIAPADLQGQASGATPLTRLYGENSTFKLTAPAKSGTNTFVSWAGCTTSNATECNVTMKAATTVEALYLPAGGVEPTVTVAPFVSNFIAPRSLPVVVTIGRPSNFTINPTGSITLTSGAYTSAALRLPSNNISITFNVPTGMLAIGKDTLKATFTPDKPSSAYYNGASGTASVQVFPAQTDLLELGHTTAFVSLFVEGGRVLSADQNGYWALWNEATHGLLSSGDNSQPNLALDQVVAHPVDMAGSTVAVAIPNLLILRAQSDGHILATIPVPGLDAYSSPFWWKLASDGSYVCILQGGGLNIYSPTGQLIASKAGGYPGGASGAASVFAAPGKVLVAGGPAGKQVIESISTTTGASTVSKAFSGNFQSWFLDGGRFLTTLGTTVWEYSDTADQQGIVALPSIEGLTGQGNWIWTYDSSSYPDFPVSIYPIGSDEPALTYNAGGLDKMIGSGAVLADLTYEFGQMSVIDLSGSTPVKTDYSVPMTFLDAFAAASGSTWVVGDEDGALLDSAGLPDSLRYFGHGKARSIAGATGAAAVSTAIGETLVFDPAEHSLKDSFALPAGKVALSADGTVLGASASALDFYALPSKSLISSFPYTGNARLLDFTLAASGETIGQISGVYTATSQSITREVTSIAGGTPIWSDTPATYDPAQGEPILLSPDGTLIAVYTGEPGPSSVTDIYKNGKLVTAVPGLAIGWLDNNRLLLNQFSLDKYDVLYAGAVIYSPAGVLVAKPPLPQLGQYGLVQPAGSESVYDPLSNAVYSLASGEATWKGAFPSRGIGAVAGPYIVYESTHSVLMEPY